MQFRKHTLDNGLEIVAECNPRAYSTALGFFVKTGSRDETDENHGVSHFLEHMTFKGTERRPTAIDIAEAIEGDGGILNAYTSQEITCYWNQVPFDKLTLAMDVLADMMQHAIIDGEEGDR